MHVRQLPYPFVNDKLEGKHRTSCTEKLENLTRLQSCTHCKFKGHKILRSCYCACARYDNLPVARVCVMSGTPPSAPIPSFDDASALQHSTRDTVSPHKPISDDTSPHQNLQDVSRSVGVASQHAHSTANEEHNHQLKDVTQACQVSQHNICDRSTCVCHG